MRLIMGFLSIVSASLLSDCELIALCSMTIYSHIQPMGMTRLHPGLFIRQERLYRGLILLMIIRF